MAAFDIESVIKNGVERALNEPIMNGKSVMQWAEIGMHSQEQKFFVDSDGKMTPLPIQKHGHWKGFTQSRYFGTDDDGEPIFRDGVFYVCSECRRKSIIRYPYCPRCGAKMDEEVKQE